MSKKPSTPEPGPKKRPPRKGAAPKPTPAKKAPPAKKKAAGKPEPKEGPLDPKALAQRIMAGASSTARRAVRANPAPAQAEPTAAPDDAETDSTGPLMGCTPRQARFVDLYLALEFNATKAYREAGFVVKSDAVAAVNASRMLGTAKVRSLLAARAKAMMERTEAEQDRLMLTLTSAAFVDPNELVGWHVGACRYCYGDKHRYQFTAGEWDAKLEAHEARREKALAGGKPDPGPLEAKGGTGYDWRKEPHPDCPECFGLGRGEMVMKDTRSLSPAARALYAGVKVGKEGTQVLMHSQEKARDTLAKIHRLYDDSTNLNLTFNGDDLSRRFEEKMAKSRARGQAMRSERFGEGADRG